MAIDARGAIFALTPIACAAWLLWRHPRTRRIRAGSLLAYLLLLGGAIAAALLIVSHVAGARVAPAEFAIVLWFAVGCRILWEVWRRAVGLAGQRYVRLARRNRRSRRRSPAWIAAIRPLRLAATCLIFAPALLATALTHRFKLSDGTDPQRLLATPFEHVRIPGRDGLALDAWFVPSGSADRTIVICHGAGANKGNFIWFLPPLMHRGYNLVLFDFRAHGGSDGRVCTYGLNEKSDVLSVVDWLKHERPQRARVIVGLGSSLGSMALARAAAEDERIAAVVLDSPFVAPRELAHHYLGGLPVAGPLAADWILTWMSLLTGGDFLHASAEPAVRSLGGRPVMVIHGSDDVLMPESHSRRLLDAARGPRELWLGPGPHSNIITTEPDEYADRLFRFLAQHLAD